MIFGRFLSYGTGTYLKKIIFTKKKTFDGNKTLRNKI